MNDEDKLLNAINALPKAKQKRIKAFLKFHAGIVSSRVNFVQHQYTDYRHITDPKGYDNFQEEISFLTQHNVLKQISFVVLELTSFGVNFLFCLENHINLHMKLFS